MNSRIISAALVTLIALPAHGITNRQPALPLIPAASTEAVMENVVAAPAAKPRVTYQQFVASHQPQSEHTFARALQWRIVQAAKPGARKLGYTTGYSLLRLQREEIGAKVIPGLKVQDLVDHCQARIAAGVKPQTVSQDITALRSTLRDYVDSNELPHEWLLVFAKAQHRLVKDQLIGKSATRDRLPTLEELRLFREYFAEQNKHSKTITDMAVVLDGLVLTGRRISELCRIERQHVNVEKKTYWVYNLKNSKGKGYHGEAALIEGAWELFEERLRVIPNEPTARLFPYNHHTCSARTTLAKKELKKEHPGLFENLRMHDNRAYCFTELLKKHYTVTQVQKGVSLHFDDKTLVRRYLRLTAVDLHQGPAGLAAR